MNRTRQVIAGVVLSITAVGAMSALSTAPATAQTTPSTTAATAKPIKLGIGDSSLGRIMVDASGMTLYMFAPDRYNVSVCEGQCLTAWPPVMLRASQSLADVELSGGLRRSKLGVAMREDGSRQVTYNGWALYYWFRDTKPGDLLGQWVNNIWWVLSEEGVPNTARIASPVRS
jgi:predicted lipoprotein with Yx(FWY)xxD motif